MSLALVLSSVIGAGLLIGPAAQPAETDALSALSFDGAEPMANTDGSEVDPSAPVLMDPLLEEKLAAVGPTGMVRAFVVLKDQPVPEEVLPRGSPLRAQAIAAHQAQIEAAQAPLLAALDFMAAQDLVRSYTPYWLANIVLVEARPAAFEALLDLPLVAALVAETEVTVASNTIPTHTLEESPSRFAFTNLDVEETLADLNLELPGTFDLMGANVTPPDLAVPIGAFDADEHGSAPGDADDVAWGVKRIKSLGAHAEGINGTGVLVAILDTGIDASHPDLDGQVTHWKDFVSSPSAAHDNNGHGTHVAGTVAGTGASGFQTGVAPGASLMGVKVLDDAGGGLMGTILEGVDYAVAHGADILSMSLGGPMRFPLSEIVMDNAAALGAVPVVAAGNGGSDHPFVMDLNNLLHVGEPGRVESAITVGATDFADRIATFSSNEDFGDYQKPDIVGPGVDVESAWPVALSAGDPFLAISGTSMATPHVAGIAALVLQEAPGLTVAQVKTLLMDTARDLGVDGPNLPYGAGLVDASAAWVARHGGAPPVLSLHSVENQVSGGDVVTTITVNLTDGAGDPIAGEDVTGLVLVFPPELFELAKTVVGGYGFEGVVTTDAGGQAVFTATNLFAGGSSNITSTFTLEAFAFGGLTRTVGPVNHANIVDVGVTIDSPHLLFNGDNATFTITTSLDVLPTGFDPGTVAPLMDVTVALLGPSLGGAVQATITDMDVDGGEETVTLTIPADITAIYGVMNFGDWDLLIQLALDVDGDTWFQIHYLTGVHEVQIPRLDVTFNPPTRTLIVPIKDTLPVLGTVVAGQQDIPVSIQSEFPNTEFKVMLPCGAVGTSDVLATATTDASGFAAFTVDIPADFDAGVGVCVPIVATAELTQALIDGDTVVLPEVWGRIFLGIVTVPTISAEIDIHSLMNPDAQGFLPGESVHVIIRTRNASTHEPIDVDPLDMTLGVTGFSDFPAPVQTSPGVFETNAVLQASAVLPMLMLEGTGPGGHPFVASEYALAIDFTTTITPAKARYQPGESASILVTVSDTRTGAPIGFADVMICVMGTKAAGGSWATDDDGCGTMETIAANEFGQATFTFTIPADAVTVPALNIDTTVIASPSKSGKTGVALTGFHLLTPPDVEPRIQLNPVGAEQIGILGLLGIPVIAPGATATYEVVTKNFNPFPTDGHGAYADVLIVKLPLIPTPSGNILAIDYESSLYRSVPLGPDGRGTFTVDVPAGAHPAIVLGIAMLEHNGVPVASDQSSLEDMLLAFMPGPDALDVSLTTPAVAGSPLGVEVTGDFTPGSDLVLYLHRKDRAGVFPTLATPGGEIGPLLGDLDLIGLLGATGDAVSDVVAPVAAQVGENLPPRLQAHEDLIVAQVEGGLSPLVGALMTRGGPGGPLPVGALHVPPEGNSGALSTEYVLPANLPGGDYVLMAEVTYDDEISTPTRMAFLDVKVHSAFSSIVETGIVLAPGWNLVSLPTTSAMSLADIQDATDGAVVKAVHWDATTGYQEVSTLESGKGYWVFAAEDTSIPVADEGIESVEHSVDGLWRMVGGAGRTASLASAFRDPVALQFQALGWNPITGDYETLTMIKAGQGAWLLSNQPGKVTVVAPPAPPV